MEKDAVNNKAKKSAKNTSDSMRNKRFLENLQASLGVSNNMSPQGNRGSRNKKTAVPPEEAISSLEEALRMISVSNDDFYASLIDAKPFLLENAATFSASEFINITTVLCEAALQQSNIYFVVDLCVTLIESDAFQLAMSESLKTIIANFLKDEEEKFLNVPDFLAQLFAPKWPRKFNRVTESSNRILFTVFNTKKEHFTDDLRPFFVSLTRRVFELSVVEQEEELDEEAIFFFDRCTQGLISFSNSGQRFIWLNFPELYDKIFSVIVELLICNTNLTRNVKAALLQLHLSMNKWSLANLPKFSNATTQTVNPFLY